MNQPRDRDPVVPVELAGHGPAAADAMAARRRRGRPSLAVAIAGGCIGLVLLGAVLGPLLWTQDPNGVDVSAALQAPSWSHPMGTDATGRDVFARVCEGARISLLAGIAVVAVGGLVGGTAGLVAGLSRGAADRVLMRSMDAILAFPALILAMAVAIGLGPGLTSGVIGIALTSVPFYARLMRNDVKRIRALPHVEAARAIGLTPRAIAVHHILPHTGPTMLVQSAGLFGFAILTLAGLGFVGLGAQIPTPEWGAMITDGLQYTLTGQWWVSVFPGVGVLLAVAGANMVADMLRDRFDPRGATLRG